MCIEDEARFVHAIANLLMVVDARIEMVKNCVDSNKKDGQLLNDDLVVALEALEKLKILVRERSTELRRKAA